jgi:hypothetical protein
MQHYIYNLILSDSKWQTHLVLLKKHEFIHINLYSATGSI